MRHPCVLVVLLVGLATAGCTSPGSDNGCDGVTCGGHGTCKVVGGSAGCACDTGYSPAGLDCIASGGCAPNPCTKLGQTRCELQNHLPVCLCDAGYHETTSGCVPDAGGPCDPNPCREAHRTQCVVQSGAAKCRCDIGYSETAGGECVSSDPCYPNPCAEAHKTVCSSQTGSAVCGCDVGYTANSQGDCILSATGCTPNPCTDAHQTVCTEVAGVAFCGCDAGYRADGAGGCVFEASCTPNPCTATHKTTCTVVNNQTHCSCDLNWVDDGSGTCVADTSGCSSQHTSGDTFEPDECGPLAKDLVVGTPQTHTLEPAGDNDWFKATLLSGHSYHFEVTGLDAFVYLYAADTVTVIESHDEPETIDYVPTADGTFYFRVRHYYSSSTGTYTVSLSELGADVGDTAATAGVATAGTPLVGMLSPAGDNDWFAFATVAGHAYSVTTTGVDTWVYLLDTDGTTGIADSDYPPIYLNAASAGPYYVRVKHYSVTGTGVYTLTITDLGADDHGNDAASATAVTPGTAATAGKIMPAGDHDWFSWTAAAGHIYKVNTTGVDTYVYVLDTNGTTVLKENDTVPLYATTPTSGTCYVRVRHYSATSTGDFTLTIEDLGADDHGNDKDHATPITVGVPTSGVVEAPTDSDWFSFTAVASHIYQVNTSGADTYVYVIGTDGTTVIKESDTVPFSVALPGGAGTYYVRVRLSSSTATGGYDVAVSDLGLEDHGGDAAHATLVVPGAPPGTPVPGRIEVGGDHDWFAFDAVAGHIYKCTTTPATFDTYVRLIDSDGTTVLKTQDDPTLYFTPSTSGRRYYDVRAYSAVNTGVYNVVITDEGTDDFPSGPVLAPTVAVGAAIAGVIESPGDQDWMAFEVPAGGGTYTIVMQSAGTLDTVVELYDTNGNTKLATGDDPEPATIANRVLTAPGKYFLNAKLYSGTATGAYTITITKQ